MERIDLSEYKYVTNIQQYDNYDVGDYTASSNYPINGYNTIGYTIDISSKKDKIVSQIKDLSKKYSSEENSTDFCILSNNLKSMGRGFIHTMKVRSIYNGYQLKFSFRTKEYVSINGKSLIREYDIMELLN
jgi:hypothetical protein